MSLSDIFDSIVITIKPEGISAFKDMLTSYDQTHSFIFETKRARQFLDALIQGPEEQQALAAEFLKKPNAVYRLASVAPEKIYATVSRLPEKYHTEVMMADSAISTLMLVNSSIVIKAFEKASLEERIRILQADDALDSVLKIDEIDTDALSIVKKVPNEQLVRILSADHALSGLYKASPKLAIKLLDKLSDEDNCAILKFSNGSMGTMLDISVSKTLSYLKEADVSSQISMLKVPGAMEALAKKGKQHDVLDIFEQLSAVELYHMIYTSRGEGELRSNGNADEHVRPRIKGMIKKFDHLEQPSHHYRPSY